MNEMPDLYIVYRFLESDGENEFGPDVYLINAHSREEAIRKIYHIFPGELTSIKMKPVVLPHWEAVHIGTLFREYDE